jgi:hypothetical protein
MANGPLRTPGEIKRDLKVEPAPDPIVIARADSSARGNLSAF